MSRYQVIGVNDDKDFCECCGRQGLKRVVFISDTETGEVKHFGTSCATSPAKGFGLDKEIKTAIARAESYQKTLAYLANRAYRAAGGVFVKSGEFTFAPADQVAYATVKANVVAQGFNY